jgi:hypothetical protein
MQARVLDLTEVPPHRTLLDGWDATLNVGSPLKFSGYRVTGPTVTNDSILIGTTPNATTTSIVDNEELPNGLQFTYWVKANLTTTDDCTVSPGDCSPPTNSATITAINLAPTANADSYSVPMRTVPLDPGLVVAAPGVLGSNPAASGYDTDDDSPRTSLKAVLVPKQPLLYGPFNGSVILSADGSFTYMPNVGFTGIDYFSYVANDGLWSDGSTPLSADSNVATVTIEVKAAFDGVQGVQNLPPPAGKTFKPGSSVPLKWLYTLRGVAVNSVTADPEVKITGPAGLVITITPQEPGHSVFKLPTASNGWTWQLNWQTDVPATGAALPPGSYFVTIKSRATGLTLGPVGPITLK